MYHEDWLMRQIELMINMIAKLVFKRDNAKFDFYEEDYSEEIHKLHEKLTSLINRLKINEAEDILFEQADNNDLGYIKVAVDFYQRINELSDEELNKGDFTRKEIQLGIEDMLKLYNISLPF